MSSDENRKYKRIEASLDVQIEIVFPEETFQPKKKGGRTLNVSEQGMKIRMFDVPEGLYKKMLSPIRYAKAGFTLPTTNKRKVLHGKMVWLDYDFQKQECTFGICFETIKHEDQRAMREYIEMLEAKKVSNIEADQMHH
jgi:c-di-GMP-binding flagellar brake protein YcgR